jgi:hypothetical protein
MALVRQQHGKIFYGWWVVLATGVGLNQTTRLWHSVAQGEKTQDVRSERSRTSGEVEEREASGLSGLRLRCATLRPNGESIHCW